MSAEIHGAGGRVAQILRDEPSALEVLVGHQCYQVDFVHASCVYTLAVAVLALVVSLLVGSSTPGFHPLPIIALAGVGIVVALAIYLWVTEWRLGALLSLGLLLAVAIVTGIGLAGPRFGEEAALLPGTIVAVWLWLSRRWALANTGIYALGYAIIVASQPGYHHPVARWIFVIGVSATVASILHWVIEKVRRLAAAESEARRAAETAHSALAVAHDELATWSHTLEARVEAQVAEIEGLSRLRRFLSPQVAEAVLHSAELGDDSLLKPHRRQIAVVFCDLRGFTSFASTAEPEEVVEALDGYYALIGDLLQRHQATVGHFAGDGIMAYFNDPVPCEDPAGTGVAMAMEMRGPMDIFSAAWSQRGFDLGYGFGIAYGYATLGTIGFESRSDYTAVGSVVNLAARLCGEAASGEILIDSRTHEAVHVQAVRRDLRLKGFASAVPAFALA